ncbi:DUF885 domain-containing protein [Salinispora tropica]|uniref:DUF885 domain-containing protein n=1 Tax=Salinispora tropica (strain ATCC BAA-916 / DSM 44818 / JCM 13857 / NBRC 105044 / CNB-440) TaxID=369723 RepID=A4X1D1_SALTO|nr:DUF885 domain-containing protein [Salinispora tropica]ABP52681.1 protein of unknown function DUF885 [Salinispora tropica CNB-440]
MGRIDDIANRYVAEWAALSPTGATYVGITGHDDRLDDLSPDGYAARADLNRRVLADLDGVEPQSPAEQTAKDAMQERLSLELARYAAGEVGRGVNVITSGLHELRSVFDLMPTDGEEAQANIAARLGHFAEALGQYQTTLREAAAAGQSSARAQLLEVAKQCDTWVDPDGDNFFHGLVERLGAGGALDAELRRGAATATAATAEFGRFLRTELAPQGRAKQAAGREHYELASQYFLGARVDLDETYAWGFEELARLETEMRAVATRIVGPGATVDEAVAALDADGTRTIRGKEAFRDWMQELADKAISELHGTHFDIPEQVHQIECCLAPTSDGAIYYTGPSEDFSRPGRMWWAVPQGIDDFSTWREVTTVYHEGVPGHHLQVAQTVLRAETLNRWQRLLCWVSGHGEGWALYAERLMEELGYLEDPGDRLGMLDGQALRAARVIVDIGMHLELEIPADNPFGFHPGERWTPELGWEFMRAHCRVSDEVLRFELNRYLGWPGQAPSYKVGERIWLQARADAKARRGAEFDLREFHRQALDLGSLGLDPLRRALARI